MFAAQFISTQMLLSSCGLHNTSPACQLPMRAATEQPCIEQIHSVTRSLRHLITHAPLLPFDASTENTRPQTFVSGFE